MKTLLFVCIAMSLASCGARRPGKVGAPGVNGMDGEDGSDGRDGYSLVVNTETFRTTDNVSCTRTDIFQDLDRNNFYSPGDRYNNGFLTCDGKIGEKGESGADGEDGQDADTTYQIVRIIDPCGAQHRQGFDEVILQLGNGQYLASFSDNANGLNTRLGILRPGSYRTTDGTNCTFTL